MNLIKLRAWHDEILLRDSKNERLYLIITYVAVGILSSAAGILLLENIDKHHVLLVLGPFLAGIGIEKLVSRRVRNITNLQLGIDNKTVDS